MNKEVFDLYKKLNSTEKSELNFRFKDSPVGIKYLSFLENTTNRSFKNTEVVQYVYGNQGQIKDNVLENRYFKLRKKVYDELNNITSSIESEKTLLADEEKKLFEARSSALANNKESAYKQLIELEKECWKKNIFELLPSIIDLLIFLNQAFNKNEKNRILYNRYEKAMDLLYDIQKVSLNARIIYEINFSKGIKHAQKHLNILKELALKHKEYPRFSMCYNHVSLYYKLGSPQYYGEMQVVSRHMSQFKKLYAQNPFVPLINYRANYVKYQHFHFAQSTMFYHFNRCEFQDALASIQEVWNLAHDADSVFRMYKTESLYSNMFTLQCMAERYDDAIVTTDLFIKFLKENNQIDKLNFAYTQKAKIYTDIFPNTKRLKTDKDFLISQLDEYIKKVKKENNLLMPYDQSLVLRMRVHLIEKNYKKAKELFKEKAVVEYFNEFNLYSLYEELIAILDGNTYEMKHQLTVLIKKATQHKYKIKTPSEYLNINWLINFCNIHKQ